MTLSPPVISLAWTLILPSFITITGSSSCKLLLQSSLKHWIWRWSERIFFHCFASQASLRIKLNCDLCRGKNCNRDHDLSVVISSKSFRTALIIMEVALELMCLSHHFLKPHYDVVIAVRDISSNAIETYVWENTAKSLWKEGRRCTKNSSNAVSFCYFAIEAKRALFISILHMVGWARPD